VALGRRYRCRVGLQLRRRDGLAPSALWAGDEPRLSAVVTAVARAGDRAWFSCRRCARGIFRRAHRSRPRSGGAARALRRSWLCALAARERGCPDAGHSPRAAATRPWRFGRAGSHRPTDTHDSAARGRVQSTVYRFHRRRAWVAASGATADARHTGYFRCGRCRLLGTAELRVARHGSLHGAERRHPLRRRNPAASCRDRPFERPALDA
jgi:hypothetical protein